MNDSVIDKYEVVDHEPWLADKGNFLSSNDHGYILDTMQYIKNNFVPLTLVVDGGEVFPKSLMTNIVDGSAQIDKPLEWGEGIKSFRVFFKDMYEKWNFFSVNSLSDNPFSFAVSIPDELFFFQKRSYQRVDFPPGTRALVKGANKTMSTVLVHDLSAAGMLFCDDAAEGKYDKDSIISDIVISIPSLGGSNEGSNVRKVLPLISQGQIVRQFVDQESQRSCYGISFQYDSSYVEETINQVVSEVGRSV